MSAAPQNPVDSVMSSGMPDSTRKLLREFAASLAHTHTVISRLLEDADDHVPLPALVFRDFVPASERWYAMIAGPRPGVYQGLQNVPDRSVPNVVIGRHATEEEARKAFNEALANGLVKQISDGSSVVLGHNDVYGA